MKKSNKLSTRLDELRDRLILISYQGQYSAEEIGEIFNLSLPAVYNIIRNNKLSPSNDGQRRK